MNVLFISYNGALEPLLQSQGISYIKGLSKNGIRMTLLSFEKRFNLNNKEAINKLNIELQESQIEWHRLLYHKNPPIFSTIYDIFLGSIYCAYLIFRRKITIIHARSYVPAAIAYILNKCFKIKFIFDMRGMMIDEYVDAKILKQDGIIYKLGRKLEKNFLISSERIIVLTNKIKNVINNFSYLKNKSNLKIEVVPCCVNLEKFNYDMQKDIQEKEIWQNLNLTNKFILIYIGSVGTWYFLEGMLDLFVVAKRNIPEMHFLFFNPGEKDLIKNAILSKNLNLNDFTIMESPYHKISNYISECDAGIIFYKQTFSRLACCPVKFAEYLACGIPVILNSGIGDTENIVTSNRIGAVVKEFNEDNYQNAINELLELKKEELSLRQRCRAVAERLFSLGYGIEKYRQIYRNLNENSFSSPIFYRRRK